MKKLNFLLHFLCEILSIKNVLLISLHTGFFFVRQDISQKKKIKPAYGLELGVRTRILLIMPYSFICAHAYCTNNSQSLWISLGLLSPSLSKKLLQPLYKESVMENTGYLGFYLLQKMNNSKRVFHVLLSFKIYINVVQKYCYSNSDTLKINLRAKGNIVCIYMKLST